MPSANSGPAFWCCWRRARFVTGRGVPMRSCGARLVELAREKPRYGYRRLHVLLRRACEVVNHML
jgi:hypothetical protein